DIRANRIAEEQHLHDRQRDQHGRSSLVSANVKELFAEQASKRSHCTPPALSALPALPASPALPALPAPPASGRARRTNSSPTDSTPNSRLSAAGVPIAAIRPATMIDTRSQYSASSM